MTWGLGQLRHLYVRMLHGDLADQPEAAKGLLGPAIEALEYEYTSHIQDAVRHTVDETVRRVLELMEQTRSKSDLRDELEKIRDQALIAEVQEEPS